MQCQLCEAACRTIAVFVFTKNCLTFQVVRKAILARSRKRIPVFMVSDIDPNKLTPSNGRQALLIVDVANPPLPVVACLELLNPRFAENTKIMLGDLTPEEMCGFLLLGINGFVGYRNVERRLPSAIESTMSGHLHVPHCLFDRFVAFTRMLVPTNSHRSGELSARQKQILALLEQRCANKEISCALHISENTVKFHLSKLYSRLGVRDRHAVVDLASTLAVKSSLVEKPQTT